jgi:hypothetical protein
MIDAHSLWEFDMNRSILLAGACGIMAGAAAMAFLGSRPVTAQSFAPLSNNSGISATAPNAAGISHAWSLDSRTNRITLCRGEPSGKISCTEAIVPGAARTPG